jgi:putative MATE family efflux protein
MMALTFVISALGVVLCAPLLRLINTPEPLFNGTRLFLSIIIGGMFVNALVQWFFAIMNAAGDSKTPFKILVVTVILNAVLAPVLITGAGIFPPLGIAGPALSTICAHFVGAAACFFVWRNHHLSEIAPFRFRVHWETLRKMIMIGFPMALQMLIVSSSFLFILSLANKFGPSVTAAFGIGSRVDQIAFLATFAVTAAVSAMTAQNIGAGKMERIPEILRWGLLLAAGMSCFFAAAVMIFPGAITLLFTNDPSVIAVARNYFYIAGVSYLALAVTFTYQGVLRGAGDTFGSFIMIACSMIFLRVPLCYYLSHNTPLREVGLWVGITVSAIAGAAAFYFYYASGCWKKYGAKAAVPVADAPLPLPELYQPE